MKPSKHLITAALPYANGPVHIGHLAGAYLPADIYVRFLRLKGEHVKFICGSDEHGVPITLRARKEHTTPQAIVDKYHSVIKKSFEDFGISFDIYHRTSDAVHHETAQDFFKTLYAKNVFIEEVSEQYFDEATGMFLADRYITGTCPNCSNTNAYGDQCEKCGKSLSPRDLINPHSQLSGQPPVLRQTKHWYLPLDTMQASWLQAWIEGKRDIWKSNVYGQCKSWIDQGLQPRAVTRDLDWGVKVPLPNSEGKVLYVWFDAPIGYISATKALTDDWKQYWQDSSARLVHFIGKDNIVFHCIVFPAMLKAHGSYILPEQVPANEFLNLEGEKISTSRNWAVWLHEYLQDFENKQDELRYTLCATLPENKDNDFTWKDFQARVNNELVAIFGNFVNRTMVLIDKYYEGKVPPAGNLNQTDNFLTAQIFETIGKIDKCISNYKFKDALFEYMQLARAGNKYLADNEPWKTFATNPDRTATVLNASLQVVNYLAQLANVFMPFTAVKLLKMLDVPQSDFKTMLAGISISEGHQLQKPSLLFQKIENEQIAMQVQKLQQSKTEVLVQAASEKAVIAYEEFEKLDLRIATILAAEKVAKTDKLLKITLKVGNEERTVVSGIAHCFNPENIIGQSVMLLANLAPRKIKGIESKGMILMADDGSGGLAFMQPSKDVASGNSIK
ncbi:MAG: methionine--tRNA ligase [Bacteroidota bacterium]|jgi:methionyl-tRNA synthetase